MSIVLNNFASMFIKEMSLKFSYSIEFLCGLGISVIVASQNEFGGVPSVSIMCSVLKRIGIPYSLKFW